MKETAKESKKADRMSLGWAIRTIRVALGLKAMDVAKKVDITLETRRLEEELGLPASTLLLLEIPGGLREKCASSFPGSGSLLEKLNRLAEAEAALEMEVRKMEEAESGDPDGGKE